MAFYKIFLLNLLFTFTFSFASSSLISHYNYPGSEALGNLFGLSAAVSFPVGNTTIVAISGQVAASGPNGDQYIGGHGQQFETALKNVEKALAAAQPALSSDELWEGIYDVKSFHKGTLPQKDQLDIAEVGRRFFKNNKPGWTAVGVASLFPPKALVEVQVQAVYPSEKCGT